MIGFIPFICGILLLGNSLYHWYSTSANMLGPCLSGVFLLIVGIILHLYFSNEKIIKRIYQDHYLTDLYK